MKILQIFAKHTHCTLKVLNLDQVNDWGGNEVRVRPPTLQGKSRKIFLKTDQKGLKMAFWGQK